MIYHGERDSSKASSVLWGILKIFVYLCLIYAGVYAIAWVAFWVLLFPPFGILVIIGILAAIMVVMLKRRK